MSAEMTRPASEPMLDEDAEHLASLGYTYDSEFKRA